MSASTDFHMTEEELTKTSERQVKMDVVIKDHTLDTVAIAHLLWVIDNKN